jgi:hypothetical protein
MKRHYVAIGAEPGCKDATLLYSLKVYDNKKNAVNGVYPFYHNHTDTAATYYNYFLSTTEALNFISNNGWTLFAIYTDTYSGHTTESNGRGGDLIPITTVSSRPWFCFKR